ncbi:MAG: hypothetical protein ACJ798_11775 [Phenylobacterium sp.]
MPTRTVVICTIAAGVASLALFGGASAQEGNPTTPGAIPNPGSYQGSTELQRQQDQQDQQFRQQQQQQPQPQYGNQSSAGRVGSGYRQAPSVDPYRQCMSALTASTLTPLRGLIEVDAIGRDPRYFTISRRPTAAEKTSLLRWAAGRRRCEPLSPNAGPVFHEGNLDMNNMIVQLAQGGMTYGEFNQRRAQKYEAFARPNNSR